jgi:hypothetical protein
VWGVVATGLSGNATLTNVPSVTATAGPSGLIDIEVGALIGLNPTTAAAVWGQLLAVCTSDPSVNDLAFGEFAVQAPAASSNDWWASVYSASTAGNLTPGTSYTFDLSYHTSSDVTMDLANIIIRAIPM